MRLKLLLIAFFLAILALPLLQMATHAIPVASLDENRNPAPMPSWPGPGGISRAVSALQAWFDDHYGFRAWLIRAKTQIDFSVFRASDKLHIGRDGYLFYRSVIDTEEPRVERLSTEDFDRVLANFARIRDLLDRQGIQLIIQTQQMKDKFYPEKLPHEARFARARHRFDDFRARLAALPGITYVDTTPFLIQLKQIRPIFHKTDLHWNDPAAFACAERLTNLIAALNGQKTPAWQSPLEIETRRFSGDQAIFMPLFRPPSEQALFVKPTWDENAYRVVVSPPFVWVATHAPDPHRSLLPPTVIFGDSFTEGMLRSGLSANFERLSFARRGSATLADALNNMAPDTKFFVIEFIEVALPSFIDVRYRIPHSRFVQDRLARPTICVGLTNRSAISSHTSVVIM